MSSVEDCPKMSLNVESNRFFISFRNPAKLPFRDFAVSGGFLSFHCEHEMH